MWDLDGTLWDGVLAEGDTPLLRSDVANLIRELDRRGVLQSLASRNDASALGVLERFGLRDYFLHPQLGSAAKSSAIARIAAELGLALDAIAFVDDEAFERAEVASVHPGVVTVDARDAATLLTRQDISIPPGAGIDRRRLHQSELQRRSAETEAGGPSEAFLATLGMRLVARRAGPSDLDRIEELMVRTNQLNTTGRFIARAELDRLCAAEDHLALVVELRDRFGDYGTIGFALVEVREERWTMRMLMVSCRVEDRGVGSAVLCYLIQLAHRQGAGFFAEYVRTEKNRRMYVTLKLAGFNEVDRSAAGVLLQFDPTLAPPLPASRALPSGPPWIHIEGLR